MKIAKYSSGSRRPMHRLPIALLLGLLATEATADSTVLRCGTLIDVEREQLVRQQDIVVADGVITAVGSGIAEPDGATVIDLTGHYCLPGLIDAHTHLMFAGPGLNSSSAEKTLVALTNAQTMLQHGYTTLRIPGDGDVGFGTFHAGCQRRWPPCGYDVLED